ncbi:MAG TPA: response regulator [Candidatus Nitrosopolaris rasttigaisensis]|nr:response regulator [Candidatus Nitrosopolaris rasttigaisensis]
MTVRMTTGFFEHTEDLVYGTLTVKEKQPFSKRVLIVDDEPDICTALKELFDEKGFKVDTFVDPTLALENFKSNLYDLSILDMKMGQL